MSRSVVEVCATLLTLCVCERGGPATSLGRIDITDLKSGPAYLEPCLYCECRLMMQTLLEEGVKLAATYRLAAGHLEVAKNERDGALSEMAAAQQARTQVQHRYNLLLSQHQRLVDLVDGIRNTMGKGG